MQIKRHDTCNHHCELPGTLDDYLYDFIETGLFIKLRRYLRRMTLIHPSHPYAQLYANSINKLRMERKIQLIHHYNMIHPLSYFAFGFNVCMTCLLMATFIGAPTVLLYTFPPRLMQIIFGVKTLTHCLLIVMSFTTGYYNKKRNTVELRRHKVIFKYLKTYFLIDIAGLLPSVLLVLWRKNLWNESSTTSRILIPFLSLIMYGRYFYCLQIFQQVKVAIGLSSYWHKGIRLVLNVIVCILMLTFALYFTMKEISFYEEKEILETLEMTIELLFLVNHGLMSHEFERPIFLPSITLMCGFLLNLLIFIGGMELWYRFSSVEQEQNQVYAHMNAYMRYKALPMSMRDRIWLYLNFKFQGDFYKSSIIKRATLSTLREEILAVTATKCMQRVQLFKNLPESILAKIRISLVSEIYLPGDIVLEAGVREVSMFFILAGTVRITTVEGKTVTHLKDGAHFGEAALVIKIARAANIVAETPCELLKLSRNSFLEALKEHPEHLERMADVAQARMTRKFASEARQQLSLLRTNYGARRIAFDLVGHGSQWDHSE